MAKERETSAVETKAIKTGNDILAPHGLRLHDRADMVKGHFCIERDSEHKGYVEYWNEEAGKWCSFGTVYHGENEALGRAMLLTANSV